MPATLASPPLILFTTKMANTGAKSPKAEFKMRSEKISTLITRLNTEIFIRILYANENVPARAHIVLP